MANVNSMLVLPGVLAKCPRTGAVRRTQIAAVEVVDKDTNVRTYIVTEVLDFSEVRRAERSVPGGYYGLPGNLCGKTEALWAFQTARNWHYGAQVVEGSES